MGHTHVLTGCAAGAAAGPAFTTGLVEHAAFTAACGGMALLPDWDARGTTAARVWGLPSQAVAAAIGWVAGGHRRGTHDALLGTAAFAGAAYAATFAWWSSLTVLAVALALTLRGLHFAVPGRAERTAIGNLVLSWGGAWLVLDAVGGPPAWLPAAVAVGVLAHIAGDALTDGGVPVPLLWLLHRRHRAALPLFKTGRPGPEAVVAALAGAATVALLAHAAGLVTIPGIDVPAAVAAP